MEQISSNQFIMDALQNYLDSTRAVFRSYKALGEKAIAQLSDAEINIQSDPESNSVALIVKHLRGNMLSRWIGFFDSDGEKPDRHRDQEFEGGYKGKSELLLAWEEGWTCLFSVLDGLKKEDLTRVVYIRKEAHTAIDAINRQLAHYPYHIGQMVYIAKAIRGGNWKSLSIPKGQSETFNKKMGL